MWVTTFQAGKSGIKWIGLTPLASKHTLSVCPGLMEIELNPNIAVRQRIRQLVKKRIIIEKRI